VKVLDNLDSTVIVSGFGNEINVWECVKRSLFKKQTFLLKDFEMITCLDACLSTSEHEDTKLLIAVGSNEGIVYAFDCSSDAK
jgi:hypothetical protein